MAEQHAGDPSVVGSTFWINTKAVTITGVAPKGFYGDRLSSTPPDFYLPIESMPVLANATHVHAPDHRWLYIIGRVKPGVAIAPLQAKITELVRQSFAATLNEELPPFLTGHAGLESGFMMLQVTAAALVAENRVLSHPASTGSITTSGNKEDFVSMGMTSLSS